MKDTKTRIFAGQNFNRLYSYGEYQYWLNNIEISKFLDNDLIGV